MTEDPARKKARPETVHYLSNELFLAMKTK